MQQWGFTSIDIIAFVFFLVSWFSYFWVVNASRLKKHTITHHMNEMRRQWMVNLVQRDLKMVDALIQNGLQHGVLFFASTSILIVGALLAGLGATDKAIDILIGLPFASETTRVVWEVKVLLIMFIFVFSFFKFAWSYRQFNYVLIMLGAAPTDVNKTDELAVAYAYRMADMHALAAQHFSMGLMSYFFALAAFSWFLNAWVFIGATIWVTCVLYRRAFASKFARMLKTPLSEYESRNG